MNTPRIIVLEGPDLAGKSTLAEELRRQAEATGHQFKLVKLGQPEVLESAYLFAQYIGMVYDADALTLDNEKLIVVFDRLHIGEWVYGPRKRGNSLLSWNMIAAIDDLLTDLHIEKVFVDAPADTLLTRYDQRGESFVSKPELLDIADAYRDLLYRHNDTREPDLHGWRRVFVDGDEMPGILS